MMMVMGLYTVVAQFVNTDALSSINIVCPILNIAVGHGRLYRPRRELCHIGNMSGALPYSNSPSFFSSSALMA